MSDVRLWYTFFYTDYVLLMPENPHHTQLTREQKTGFVLLLTFGMLTVGLGFLQMRNTIYGPFAFTPGVTKKTSQELLEDEHVKLQSIDTDHDGINDYEELYFYQTSPYIQDTDSDGLTDKEELDLGKDPLCAEGKTCNDTTEFASGDDKHTVQSSQAGNPDEPTDVANLLNPLAGATPDSVIDVQGVTSNADQIRALLKQTGKISADQIDLIPDSQLLAIVQELVGTDETDVVAREETTVDTEQINTDTLLVGDTGESEEPLAPALEDILLGQ